jgi:hypothetical protein
LPDLKQSLGRMALFLLCVVLVAISLGILLSQMHLEIHVARDVVLGASVVAAVGSYMASYTPGWLYKSLVEISKGEE